MWKFMERFMEVRRSCGNALRCVGVRVGPWKFVEVRGGSRRFVGARGQRRVAGANAEARAEKR